MSRGAYDIGVVGLGVMGANLARNMAAHGFQVAGYQRDHASALALAAAHPEARLLVPEAIEDFVAALIPPRRIVLMVPAGAPVDDVLSRLDPLLGEGDVVVDAGNSHYDDTDRRQKAAVGRPWRFMGMGVSGGAEGALRGPSIMPGGDRIAYERMRPVLEAIAAQSSAGTCVTYCGAGSAGHFVKMVHNGIEYGDMQLIAETATLLRGGLGLDLDQTAAVFSRWNEGELESFLVEITADVLRAPDVDVGPGGVAGGRLVDAILDAAGQKGTGKWTVIAALEHGVPIPTIAAAVDARSLSSQKDLRVRAEASLAPVRGALDGVTEEDLAHALYAAKLSSYAQGFALLSAASAARGYGVPLGEVARIWTAGCIIRARFLDRVRLAFETSPAPELLVLAQEFSRDLAVRVPAFRRVVAGATRAGFAVPGLAASLAWLDTITTGRGSAWLIQAQRDYFGSHSYERVGAPGVAVRSVWPRFKKTTS